MHSFLAIDLGASNGRVVLGRLDVGRLELEVVHRFDHAIQNIDGLRRWDWQSIRSGVRTGLAAAAERATDVPITSVSCATWAQDFGLLDGQGALVYSPVSYRDARSERFPQDYFTRITPEDLVARVGVGRTPVVALCQLYTMAREEREALARAATLLHMADLVHFDLCGVAKTDWTMATASQLRNLETGDWDRELLDLMQIPHHMLPEIVGEPQVLGRIPAEHAPHPKLVDVPVVVACNHDTAAASAAAGPLDEQTLFLSAGTYAMPGCVSDRPLVVPDAVAAGCALVGLAGRRWGLFTSAMGMWVIQECCRMWEAAGEPTDYEDLVREAEASDGQGAVELSEPRFHAPADMLAEIRSACEESGMRPPGTRGEVAKLVYDSMVREHARSIAALGEMVGRQFQRVHVVSGGSRNRYFCQNLADALAVPVVAGPAEATAIGNILLQAWVMGTIPSPDTITQISVDSFPRGRFRPR
ncbi:MAG: FGGY family carbohydrate kinase [Candidatus Latescibacteria bacterium]|nr:FGGY family carbohydrate kinase [Candidatus Latescibacterota bacterium]